MRLLLLATASLVATLAAAVPSASAAGETCRGRVATHVGAPGATLVATEGADVVVTNGAARVDALGGDDLVCVTGSTEPVTIDAGAGDDTVDASTALSNRTTLGPGADHYTGSSRTDVVFAGTGTAPYSDTEADVISTGARNDYFDEVTSGQAGVPNPDQVMLGRGTATWAGTPTPTTVLDGGAYSWLELAFGHNDSPVIDNVAGTLTNPGVATLHFSGFRYFDVQAPDGTQYFEFRGSDGTESLDLTFDRAPRHRVSMGAGSDHVSVTTRWPGLPRGTSYDGGAGARDRVHLVMPAEHDLDLDLDRGRLSTGRRAAEVTNPARGFEMARVTARNVGLVGTPRPNTLSVDACRARVEGLGGADRVEATDESEGALSCRVRRATMLGGPGHDALVGGAGPDRLIGGRGRDSARGAGGRDVCQAEERHGCETRL
jgi:Ca2+-binding RTX toxin-like protein